MYSLGTEWICLGWSIRSSFQVSISGAGTTGPQRINVMYNSLFHWCHMNTSLQFWVFETFRITLDEVWHTWKVNSVCVQSCECGSSVTVSWFSVPCSICAEEMRCRKLLLRAGLPLHHNCCCCTCCVTIPPTLPLVLLLLYYYTLCWY